MRASSKRIVSFILSIVFLVASFIVYGSLLRPEYEAVNTLRGELASKQSFVEDQEEIITQVQELITRYQGARGLEESISLALPREEATASLLNQIVTIAKNAQLSLRSVTFAQAPLKVGGGTGAASAAARANTKVGTLVANIDANGSYEALKVFLRAVETNIRVMDIAEVKADPRDPRAIDFRLSIYAYYQVQ